MVELPELEEVEEDVGELVVDVLEVLVADAVEVLVAEVDCCELADCVGVTLLVLALGFWPPLTQPARPMTTASHDRRLVARNVRLRSM